jgi:hypothetical protein
LAICVVGWIEGVEPGIQTRERALAGSCEEDYQDEDLGDIQMSGDLGDGQLEGEAQDDQGRGCQVDWEPCEGQAGAILANQPRAGSPAAVVFGGRVLDDLRLKQQDPEFIPSSCCKNPGRSRQRKGPAGQRGQKQASGRDRQDWLFKETVSRHFPHSICFCCKTISLRHSAGSNLIIGQPLFLLNINLGLFPKERRGRGPHNKKSNPFCNTTDPFFSYRCPFLVLTK